MSKNIVDWFVNYCPIFINATIIKFVDIIFDLNVHKSFLYLELCNIRLNEN